MPSTLTDLVAQFATLPSWIVGYLLTALVLNALALLLLVACERHEERKAARQSR